MVKFNVGGSWELGCAYFESLVDEIIRLFESIVTKVKEKILLQNTVNLSYDGLSSSWGKTKNIYGIAQTSVENLVVLLFFQHPA